MFGAFFWGGLSDKLGRRQCLLISMSVNGFFAFLSSFVQGYSMFLFCRMVSGFGWVELSALHPSVLTEAPLRDPVGSLCSSAVSSTHDRRLFCRPVLEGERGNRAKPKRWQKWAEGSKWTSVCFSAAVVRDEWRVLTSLTSLLTCDLLRSPRFQTSRQDITQNQRDQRAALRLMLDDFRYISRNKNLFNILRLDYCSPLYSSINQASTHSSLLEQNAAARFTSY